MTTRPRGTGKQRRPMAGQPPEIADADPAQDTGCAPVPAAVTWVRAQLRQRIQQMQAAAARAAEPARTFTAGRQAGRAVTSAETNIITKDMTPAEAANLLAKLEEGHQAA